MTAGKRIIVNTLAQYSKDIINSAATDVEVLTAIIDLMNILITGNQLVVTGKHNF